MLLTLIKNAKWILIVILLTGSLGLSILTSGIKCLTFQDKTACDNFVKDTAMAVWTPQIKMAKAIDNLKNADKVPEEFREQYIGLQKTDITVSIIITFFWLYVIVWITRGMLTQWGLGEKLFAWLLAFVVLAFIQSITAQLIFGEQFHMPFEGFWKLLTNLDLLSPAQNVTASGNITANSSAIYFPPHNNFTGASA